MHHLSLAPATRPATGATEATQAFAVRLEAAACPNPFGGEALPALSQNMTVHAADRAAAYKVAVRTNTLPLMGQTLLVFIDGTQQVSNH